MAVTEILDGEALIIGTTRSARLQKYTKDANANAALFDLNPGGAVDVPVLLLGVRLGDEDLGMFDGLTQPLLATIDLDRDSYVGFHYSSDDTPVVRMRVGGAGTVRNHTLPDVASDTFTLIATTQTLTNKTITAPVLSGTITGTYTLGGTPTISSPTITGAIFTSVVEVADNIRFTLGDDNDIVLYHRTTILGANIALATVVVGTPVTPAIAADSLIISNVTANGDILVVAQTAGNSQAYIFIDASVGSLNLYGAGSAIAIISSTAFEIEDDILFALGNDQDVVLVNRSTVLGANTALTGALIGTPVTPAVAANSLVLANATASGDILIAGNLGGNSRAYAFIDVSADTFDLMTAGVSRLFLAAAGLVAIGDTANANMTVGLTINQGANDNQIFALKSSDVSHGITSALGTGVNALETDDYYVLGKRNAAGGGAFQLVVNGGTGTAIFQTTVASGANLGTAKTTGADGAYTIYVTQHDGANALSNVVADGNIFIIQTRAAAAATTRFIFDTEGSGHADVEWVAFDKYDDLLALDRLQVLTTGSQARLTPERYGSNPLLYNRAMFEDMGIVGRDSWHIEDPQDGRPLQHRQMVNFTRLAMLHHGAILQVADRVLDAEQRIAVLEAELILKERRIAQLEAGNGNGR